MSHSSHSELTVTEVAKRLGLTVRMIQRYCGQGVFPNAYRLGPGINSRWVIPERDVQEFERKHRPNR